MRNISYILFSILILYFLSGCSKNNQDKIIGKWKIKSNDTEVIYEFTKTNLNIEMKTATMAHPPINTTYTVKSIEGDNIILTVIHPVTGEKGDFKAVLRDNTMHLTDPDGQTLVLTKE